MTQDTSPPKPKFTREDHGVREADRQKAIQLRMAIGRALDEGGLIDPSAIGTALGLPALKAERLLIRHRWREGDVALLEAAAARLGLTV